MKFRIKAALFALSAGAFALQSASCFARFLGDFIADQIALRSIP